MNTYFLEQLIAPPYLVSNDKAIHNSRGEGVITIAPCVLTIGNFDGVHLGHQAMLEKVRTVADEQKLSAAVMIFEPQPREFFAPQRAPARLTNLAEKQALLAEYGVCLPRGVSTIRKNIPMLLDDDNNDLSGIFKTTLRQLAQQLASLDASIAVFDKAITQASKNNDVCIRLQSIPGIGPMVSSAYFNDVGNGSAYRKGRDVSASLGLIPKQHSSGGKDVLLGVSKKKKEIATSGV